MIRSNPKPRRQRLTFAEVEDLRLDVLSSQLEAEAIQRGVELATVCRCYLLAKLVEAGMVV